MMLEALVAYAEREGLGDPDFEPATISWLIPLSGAGERLGPPIDLRDNPQRRLIPTLEQKWLTIGSKPRARFCCDALQRAAGWAGAEAEAGRAERDAKSLAFFRQLLLECQVQFPASAAAAGAVAEFVGNGAAVACLGSELAEAKAKPNQLATYLVEGKSILEAPGIKEFWRHWRAGLGARTTQEACPCLATGELAEPVATCGMIKGVPEGNPSGTVLLSFDKDAFCSFGLEQARNASLSAAAELKIRSALQALIDKSRAQKLYAGNALCLHWTREPQRFDPLDVLAAADPEAVAQLLRSVAEGRPGMGIDSSAYYAACLSGNGARIVVRDWLASTVSAVERRAAQWFTDLGIVDASAPGAPVRHAFSLGQLTYALANEKLEDKFASVPHAAFAGLLHAALAGGPIPTPLLAAALRREAVERGGGVGRVVPARIALIKAYLLRSPNRKDTHTMTESLDTASIDSAYLCGQLFAVLGRLQLIALGKVGASIADRTYGGVASRPATTLGPIFSKVPAYIKKANDRWGGAGTNKQKEIENLCQRLAGLGGLPRVLDLEEQARFALAYYCQLAAYRARTEEAKLEEEAGQIEDPAQ